MGFYVGHYYNISLSPQVVFTLSFLLLVTAARSPVPLPHLFQGERHQIESLASSLERENTVNLSSLLLTSAPRKALHKVSYNNIAMDQLLRNLD